MSGRTALVTGATRGIGRAIAARLARNGTNVIGIARTSVPNFPGTLVVGDLAKRSEVERISKILVEFNAIDIVVNNAGLAVVEPVDSISIRDVDEMWQVNVQSALTITQALLPRMYEQRWGRIINISSGAITGKVGRSGYSATKAALVGLTRTMALELAPRGVTANVIAPGQITTELFASNNPPGSPKTQALLASLPAKRLGEPDEVAAAVEFFASEGAAYINGQLLHVCGGLSLGKAPV